MTKDEALKLALEAMEYADACLKKQLTMKYKHEYAQDLLLEAGTAIYEALAQPEQEPYAIEAGYGNGDDTYSVHIKRLPQGLNGRHKDWSKLEKLLYTTPPQRTWVGLTDGEVDKMILLMGFPPDWITENAIVKNIVRNLEAKLKEKNT